LLQNLKKLVSAAKKEKDLSLAHFGEKRLMIHAQTEEEVCILLQY